MKRLLCGLVVVLVAVVAVPGSSAGAPPALVVPSGFTSTTMTIDGSVTPFSYAYSIGLDPAGNLVVGTLDPSTLGGCFGANGQLHRLNADGTSTDLLVANSGLDAPQELALGPGGTWPAGLYIADSNSNAGSSGACGGNVFRAETKGTLTTLTSNGVPGLGWEPRGLAFGDGAMWIAEAATWPNITTQPDSGYIERVGTPGDAPKIVATGAPLGDPSSLQFGPGGAWGTDLYIDDIGEAAAGGVQPSIERMDPATDVVTVFSDQSHFPGGTFNGGRIVFSPPGPFGDLMYAINNASTRQVLAIDPSGDVTPFATLVNSSADLLGVAFSADGTRMYVLLEDGDTGTSILFQVTPNTPPAPTLTAPADGARIVGNSVEVTGSAEAGATVTVYADGAAAGTLTADSTGSFDGAVTLAYGTHTLAVSQTVNAVESSQTASRSITVAPAAPTLTAPADGSSTVGTGVDVSGSAEPAATVTAYVDGVSAGTVAADASGAFDVTIAIGYGAHSISVSQTLNGIESSQSAAHAFTVVPAAPTLTAPADGATLGSTTVAVSGTAVPNATVDVSDGSVVVATTSADASGAFATTVTLGLGPHSLTATQTVNGETSASSAARAVTVDVPPTLATPADGALIASSSIGVSGTALPSTAVHVFAGAADVGSFVADAGGAWSGTIALADGMYALTAKQLANGFVSSPSAAHTITVDTTPPVLNLPPNITTTNPVVTYTVTATDAIDPSPTVSCTPPSGSTFAVGPSTVDCRATDAAGNVAHGSFTVTVTPSKTPLQRLTDDANAIGNANLKAHVRNLGKVGGNGYCSQLKVIAAELAAIKPQTATTADALDAVAALQRAAGCSR